MGNRSSRGLLIVAALLLSLLGASLTGCGGESDDDGTLTIAVVPMGTTHEFWKSIHAGALKASREEGVDIFWKGPLKEDDREEQISIVEDVIAAGVDAIVLSPMDDRALMRPVTEASRHGIPTILVNSSLQGDLHAAHIATDNYKAGALGARHMGEILGNKSKLIIVRVNEADVTCTLREKGFIETIRSEFPDIDILSDNQYAGVTTETAYRTCENLLNRFPEVEAIFTPNESSTFGCLRALEDRGLAGKVRFVGFDSTDKLIQALEKREIDGLVIQNPVRMGYDGVKTAVAILREEPFEKLVDTGAVVATPDNMRDPEIESLLSPDLSILDE